MTKDMKFIRWPEYGAEELFDLKTDPNELENRITDAARRDEIALLKSRLAEASKSVR